MVARLAPNLERDEAEVEDPRRGSWDELMGKLLLVAPLSAEVTEDCCLDEESLRGLGLGVAANVSRRSAVEPDGLLLCFVEVLARCLSLRKT